ICRIGTTFKEFTRCLPASRVETNWAWRSTSRGFITPKRDKRGNDSTISVVMRGRSRRTSRIARRVGSESAFHPGSRLSSLPAISRTPLLAVLSDSFQHVTPSGPQTLSVLRIDHPDCPMPQGDSAASSYRFNFDFQMIVSRIGHEQRATQFQQGRRLDHLHEAPQMSDSLSSIPIPPPSRFRLKQQLQGLAIGRGVAFPEAVEERRECLLRRGFDVYMLLNVER